MRTKCRFPFCCWVGEVGQLYNHCTVYHHKYIKFIGNDDVYTFTAQDIMEQIYVLYTFDGLYWFLLDNRRINFSNKIRRGILAIGNSSICTYSMSLTIPGTELAYCGPQLTTTNPDQHDMEINFDKMPNIYPYLTAMKMFIKFEKRFQRADNECDMLSNILDLEDKEKERERNSGSPNGNLGHENVMKCNLCSKQLWEQTECPLCFDQFSNMDDRHKEVSKSKAIEALVGYLMN